MCTKYFAFVHTIFRMVMRFFEVCVQCVQNFLIYLRKNVFFIYINKTYKKLYTLYTRGRKGDHMQNA